MDINNLSLISVSHKEVKTDLKHCVFPDKHHSTIQILFFMDSIKSETLLIYKNILHIFLV